MDIYYSSRERFNKHYLALSHSAAYDLSYTAKIVSSRHINDFFLKARFEGEIKSFIDANFDVIRNAKGDTECRNAIDNIKRERAYLEKQGTMLSLQQAKVFMTVSMERHNKEIGYIINSVGLVVSGTQVVGGLGLVGKGVSVIGKLAGAYIMLNGISSGIQKIKNLFGDDEYIGFMEKGYIRTADFLGFDKNHGAMAYHALDMASSMYGIAALRFKPGSNRLFYYIPSDYYRKFSTMSRTALGLKFIGAGNKIRVISDINKEIE